MFFSAISVRRKLTRWRMPPDNCAGRAFSKLASPKRSKRGRVRLRASARDAPRFSTAIAALSRAVRQGNSRSRCGMSAQCASRCRAVLASSTRTSPVSDSRRPATIRRRVVLPPPLGPTNPTLDWRGTRRLMPVRATTSPKAFPASRSSIAMALAVPATGVSSPYAGITRSGSDGRWRGPCGQPPSQPGQPELPCGCGPMLPPEAGIHSWHLLHDAALSQGVAHSAGYPGELSAKVTRKIFPG
jgi:hypothetical protein